MLFFGDASIRKISKRKEISVLKKKEKDFDDMSFPEQKKWFEKQFSQIDRSRSPDELFFDFCTVSAIAMANIHLPKNDPVFVQRECTYMNLVNKYGDKCREVFDAFAKLSSNLFFMLNENIEDVLGAVYMNLNPKRPNDQFFTPSCVSECMTAMLYDSSMDDDPDSESAVMDLACGSGALLIGRAKSLAEQGVDYQEKLVAYAADIDLICVYMTYIQLSLLGIKARVLHGDSLKNEYSASWYTPACYALSPAAQ